MQIQKIPKASKIVESAQKEIDKIFHFESTGSHVYIFEEHTRKSAALSGMGVFRKMLEQAKQLEGEGKFSDSLWVLHTSSRLWHTITDASGYNALSRSDKNSFEKLELEKEFTRIWKDITNQIEKDGKYKLEAILSLEYFSQTLHSLSAWGSSAFESYRFKEVASKPEFLKAGPIAAAHVVKLIDGLIESERAANIERAIELLQSNRQVLYAYGRVRDENRLNARFTTLLNKVNKKLEANRRMTNNMTETQRLIHDAFYNHALRQVVKRESLSVIKLKRTVENTL